jgi:hypothetical protein
MWHANMRILENLRAFLNVQIIWFRTARLFDGKSYKNIDKYESGLSIHVWPARTQEFIRGL